MKLNNFTNLNYLTRSDKIAFLQDIAERKIKPQDLKIPLHFNLMRDTNGIWQEIGGDRQILPIVNDNPESYYKALHPDNEISLDILILADFTGIANPNDKPYNPPH